MITDNKLNKVAEVTIIFWIMKIIATTLGETLGDFISITLDLGYSFGLFATLALFLTLLFIQLYAKKFIAVIYWFVIIATTTLGTEISDFIDRSLHLGYSMGSLLLSIALILTLTGWFKQFKSLRVFPIADRQIELYYWIAILFSNSLGTAFGDYLSDVIGLSYLSGAFITASIIIVVLLLHYFTRINQIFCFGSLLFLRDHLEPHLVIF